MSLDLQTETLHIIIVICDSIKLSYYKAKAKEKKNEISFRGIILKDNCSSGSKSMKHPFQQTVPF